MGYKKQKTQILSQKPMRTVEGFLSCVCYSTVMYYKDRLNHKQYDLMWHETKNT